MHAGARRSSSSFRSPRSFPMRSPPRARSHKRVVAPSGRSSRAGPNIVEYPRAARHLRIEPGGRSPARTDRGSRAPSSSTAWRSPLAAHPCTRSTSRRASWRGTSLARTDRSRPPRSRRGGGSRCCTSTGELRPHRRRRPRPRRGRPHRRRTRRARRSAHPSWRSVWKIKLRCGACRSAPSLEAESRSTARSRTSETRTERSTPWTSRTARCDGRARCPDASTSRSRRRTAAPWRSRVTTTRVVSSSPPTTPTTANAVGEDAVYVADIGGGLYRLDPVDGDRGWSFQFNEVVVRSSPVIIDRWVLLGLNDGRLVAVDAASGRLNWQSAPSEGLAGTIAASSEAIVAVRGGNDPGLVAFENDPDGRLIDEPSPTELEAGTTLTRIAVASVIVLAAALVPGVLIRRRMGDRALVAADAGDEADEERED